MSRIWTCRTSARTSSARGAGQREVGLVGNGWPGRVLPPRPLVPGAGHPGEAVPGRLEALHRPGPGGRHVDVEGAGERGLVGQETQERGDARAQRRFGAEPILRGRWRPSAARRDEAEHDAMVQAELAKLNA